MLLQIEFDHGHAVDLEARIRMPRGIKAAGDEARADEEQQRHRHLRDHEDGTKPPTGGAAR